MSLEKLFPKATKIQKAIDDYKDKVLYSNYGFIMGIDISLNSSGVVVLDDKNEVVLKCNIKPKLSTSIERISYTCDEVVTMVGPLISKGVLVVIEKPFGVMGSGLILLEANGAIKNKLFARDVPVVQVPQTTLKKFATNRGGAKKCDMVESANEYGFVEDQDDIVDAFFLARLGYCLIHGSKHDYQKRAIGNFWDKFSI